MNALDLAGRPPDEVVAPRKMSTMEIVDRIFQLQLYLSELEAEENRDQAAIDATAALIQEIACTDLAHKIDALGWVDRKLEAEELEYKAEGKMISARCAAIKKARDRNRNLITWALLKLDPAERKLKGKITSVRMDPGKESLNIFNEALIPKQYRTAVVEMPVMLWDAVFKALPVEVQKAVLDGAQIQDLIDEGAVKAALLNKQEVPGAELKKGDDYLVMTHAGKNIREARKAAQSGGRRPQ